MTKPDLSRQSIIPSGNTASFDGSISIGEKLLVNNIEFAVSGITSGQTLVYNSSLNKLLPTSIDLNASSTLSGMTDVNFTTLVSGDTIVWNSATNKWENNNIVLNTDSIINTSTVTGSTTTNALDNLNTNKADLVAGKVPTSQLPSYVDDVIEGYYYTSIFYEDSGHTITITGETSKIYIDLPTNLTYRWSGSVYIEISSTTLLGTTNRITVTGSTIDIASTYTGQTSIDTVGGITTGSWSGTSINDAYISSASTWNAKQNQLNGNGFVRTTGTTIDYLSGTTNQFVKADGSLDSNVYTTVYIIPNYYRVDLNNGNDSTGVAGREDKPYLTIQTVWDLIPVSSTAQITIEIVGDFTFTTHALLTSVLKDNITFLFKGKITYAVPATITSRPLFTFSGTNNNLTFIVPNYAQTTQGGFIYTYNTSGFRCVFDNMQVLLGVTGTLNNNYGFYALGGAVESYFQCNNLTVSLTGDGSGIKGYTFPMQLVNCNYRINTFKITGTASVASTEFKGFAGTVKSIYIENLTTDNTYTNITNYNITDSALACDNVYINNINISAGGTTTIATSRSLFNGTIKNLTIMSGSILNYSTITSAGTSIENINLGNLTINGVIAYTGSIYFQKNINLLGNITKTIASQNNTSIIGLGQNGQVNGNGFKIYHADPTYLSTSSVIELYSSVTSAKAIFINNLTIYNTSMPTGNVQAFVPIMYYWTNLTTLRFRNLVVSSNVDVSTDPLLSATHNIHANTSFIRPYQENTSYICRIEGNVATNCVKNVTNLTNDCDIDLINGYTL
jgi:hypothetical protein